MYTHFHFFLISNQKWNWRKIPFNISTSNIWRLIFLHICPNPNVAFLWNLSIFSGFLLVTTLVLIYMSQMTKEVNIFKFLGPLLYLLLWSVCSNHLPILLNICPLIVQLYIYILLIYIFWEKSFIRYMYYGYFLSFLLFLLFKHYFKG